MQQLYADGKYAEIGPLVDACLPKDEAGNFIASQEKSDVVHDLLAFLAERMLEMNKQKQTEVKGFLGWLESYLPKDSPIPKRSQRFSITIAT